MDNVRGACNGHLLNNIYLECQGDIVSRLITPMTHIVTPVIPLINLLTKSLDPPSRDLERAFVLPPSNVRT